MNNIKKMILKYRERMDEHIAVTVSTAAIHRETFLPYKNYCKGEKDIVVCGAGPTLQKYQPIEGALHIAVNRAFLYDKVDFDIIFAQDMDGIRMVQQELIDYRPKECVKFLAQTADMNKKTIPESLAIKCHALRFNCDYYIYRDGFRSKPVLDLESRALGGMPNVGMSVMQLALYMNPKRIYIVGCDMSGNHFNRGEQSKEEEAEQEKDLKDYWENEGRRLLDKWGEVKKFAEIYYPDTEIVSVNPIGLKGMFKDYYQ